MTPLPWRVLIVEDDPIIAMLLQDMVEQLGCTVVGPAGSVTAAMRLLEDVPITGALLDCNLGGEKVWPVADRLTERHLPFVFSTGYGEAGVERRFAGVPVLAKPYDVKRLREVLMPLLNAAAGHGAGGQSMSIRRLLPDVRYLDADAIAILQRAYDEVWPECTIDFASAEKLSAAQCYVARALLAAYEENMDLQQMCMAGREALARLRK